MLRGMGATVSQPESGPRLLPWAVAAGAILAQQVGSKAVRDGLFLSHVSVAALPRVMLVAALLAVPIVLGVSYAITRFGPGRVAASLLLMSAVLFGVEWALLPSAGAIAAWLLFVHIATLGGTTISAFYSCVTECFDPHTARRASSRILSGAAIGGLIGGLLVTLAARALGERVLLAALGVMNLLCALALLRMAGRATSTVANTPVNFVLVSLSKSSYLRSIAYMVFLTGLVSALLDFGFKNTATVTLGSGPELLQMFAVFHSATALLTAAVQVSLAHRALERWGLSATLATLPVSILLGGALGAALPKLWGQTLLRGASSVLESSLYRSAYEPLYTPLSQRTRRSTKTLIDVAGGRLGEALGSGSLLLLALLDTRSASRLLWLMIVLGAALCLQLSLRLHSGYVAALTASLRKGSVQLQAAEIADSTTRLTMSQTHAEISRADLLQQLAALRPQPSPSGPAPPPSEPPTTPHPTPRFSLPPQPVDARESAPLLAAAGDLLSLERARVLRVLERPLDTRLVAFAIPLLAHSSLIEPVTHALRRLGERVVGQLVDAMHDPKLPLVARRRIPRILKSTDHPRAANALTAALGAPERELRHRAATALAELIARNPKFAPDSRLVYERVREELNTTDEEPATLHHLFALLSLVLERDALWLARRALTHGDAMQRGTALEYLHSTLPEPLRGEFVARLESGQIRTRPSLRVSRPPTG
jgi:ATP:ADP antiporter, AAA family